MLTSALNDMIGDRLANIAVSQILMDKINSFIKINTFDVSSVGITSSIGLVSALLKILGVSFDEVVEYISDFLTARFGKAVTALDWTVRLALLSALDAMVSCADSPVISDDMMFEKNEDGTYTPATKPLRIALSSVDLFNFFSKYSPTGEDADYHYGDVPSAITPSMTWKSGDMDAFIWYVMNCVEPYSEWDKEVGGKLIWDNRNKKFKNRIEKSDPQNLEKGEMEGYDGNTAREFWGYGDGDIPFSDEATRKEILRLDYDERTSMLSVQFPKSTYGEKRIFGFELKRKVETDENPETEEEEKIPYEYDRNGTIYEFNKDYIANLRLFYLKPIVASIMDTAVNGALSIREINIGMFGSLEEEIIKGEVSKIITKIIESDDTEVEDCYFSFSNDEYDQLVHEAELRRKGITEVKGDTNFGTSFNVSEIVDQLDTISPAATLEERKTSIKNMLTVVAGTTGATDDVINTKWNWNWDSFTNKLIELLKSIIMNLIEAVLTPRVVLIFLIDFRFANGRLPKNALDFLSGFLKLLQPVIKSLVDFFIDYLFDKVVERYKQLMEIFLQKLALEQMEKFKKITLDLINNCTLNLYLPNMQRTQLIGNIDNVVGADIVETKSSPGKDNC